MRKLSLTAVFFFLFLSDAFAGDRHENGYKGQFQQDAVIVRSLFDCEEFVLHRTAGEEGYGTNLALAGGLDVFEKGDSFTVIERAGEFTRVVARHLSGDRKGTGYEGWILDDWLWDAEHLPRETEKPVKRQEKGSKDLI